MAILGLFKSVMSPSNWTNSGTLSLFLPSGVEVNDSASFGDEEADHVASGRTRD